MSSKTLTGGKKIIAVLPAYNAAKTLERTFNDIPKEWVSGIILVDDASRDNTVEISRSLGIKTFVHSKNKGYGGNQKTCYKKALDLGADIVVMVHPDHQYDPKAIPQLIAPIIAGTADAVFGSRMAVRKNALKGGMPYRKFIANIILTKTENFILGLHLSEYHSGFRAYSKKVLQTVPFEENSNDFVFDTEIIVQLRIGNFRVPEVPIETRYFPDASMIGLSKSVRYGFGILRALVKYMLQYLRIKRYKQYMLTP